MINTDTDIANDAPQLIGYRAVTFDICTVIEQNIYFIRADLYTIYIV